MLPRLVAFDPEAGGHHASYLHYLVDAAADRHDVRLHLAITPELPKRHPNLTAAAARAGVSIREVHPRPLEDARLTPHLPGPARLGSRALAEWRSLTHAATDLQASHAVAMYFDPLLLPLALGLRAPCPVSGIYFRPTFHYPELSGKAGDWRERVRAVRQLALVRLALRNPSLHTLFCLDPFAVDALRRLGPEGRKARALADPVAVPRVPADDAQALRHRAGIEPGRRVALVFGVITTRKGITKTLRAVEALRPQLAATLAVVIVGKVAPHFRAEFEAAVASARAASQAQIVVEDSFVPDAETPVWFALAELVLVPYERHVGSSGILIRAAAGARPVLADAFGLVGAQVRLYGLGRAIETDIPAVFAAALAGWLSDSDPPRADAAGQARFAAENRPEAFAGALLDLARPP